MPRHRTLATHVCEACGTTFTFPASRLRFRPSRFCSRTCLYAGRVKSLKERFRSHVGATTPTGCVLWTGATNSGGYGMLRLGFQKRMVLASRVAWEIANGTIPDGMQVLHNCPDGDNPLCVNPAHLWLGTHQDNMADRGAKKRTASKLTAEQVKDMRRRVAAGELTAKQAAEEYKTSDGNVCMIVARKTWRHI